jgi:hypothetical protein
MVGDQLDPVTHRRSHTAVHPVLGGVRRQFQQSAGGAACELLDR